MSANPDGSSRPRRDPDAGDTLIEIVISVAILGICVVGLMVGFFTSIATSTTYRALADSDTVLRTAVDEITSQMQQNAATAFACPETPSVYAVTGLPAGYSAQVTSVAYWVDGVAQTACASSAPQLLSLTVTYTSAQGNPTSSKVGFVVNDPQAPAVDVGTTASKLVFLPSGGPSDTTAGEPMPNQPQVAVEDSSGRIVTTDLSPIQLTITSATNPNHASLANCTGSEYYGVVDFNSCEIDVAGTYTLTASNGVLTGVSSTFTVSPGPAARMVFSRSPSSSAGAQASTGGTPFAQQPKIALYDAFGNPATNDSSTVSLAITSGTGPAGAALTCTSPSDQQAVSGGTATFAGCGIDRANPSGSGTDSTYTLTASDGSLAAVTSLAFTVGVGPASQLAFTAEPASGTGGTPFPSQPAVSVEDAGGNVVVADHSTIKLAISTGTGTAGAALTCAQPADQEAATSGVAAFSKCSIDKAGTGYTLMATDGTLTAAVSVPFDVTVGPAAKLAFTTSPGGSIVHGQAFPVQPVVAIEDAGGNPVTNDDTSQVTLSITPSTGSSGSTLTCASPGSRTETASGGRAAFSNCSVSTAGSNYSLQASSGTLSAGTSSTFDVG